MWDCLNYGTSSWECTSGGVPSTYGSYELCQGACPPAVTEIKVIVKTVHYAGDCTTFQTSGEGTYCYSCPGVPARGTFWQYPTGYDPYDCYERIYTYVANYHRVGAEGCLEAQKIADGELSCS